MNVYVENILAAAATLTAAEILPEYDVLNLLDNALANNVVFTGTDGVITAGWGLNNFAGSIAILGSNWTTGHITVFSQGTAAYDADITSRGSNTIIQLPGTVMITGMTLALSAPHRLQVGILFVGKRLELPLFNVGFKYKRNVESSVSRTRYGIVYGLKQPSLRSFQITFKDIDNERREEMERYIEDVQYVQPHLVEPYESDNFLPLWAVLDGAGDFGKREGPGFRWDTALSYTEAK